MKAQFMLGMLIEGSDIKMGDLSKMVTKYKTLSYKFTLKFWRKYGIYMDHDEFFYLKDDKNIKQMKMIGEQFKRKHNKGKKVKSKIKKLKIYKFMNNYIYKKIQKSLNYLQPDFDPRIAFFRRILIRRFVRLDGLFTMTKYGGKEFFKSKGHSLKSLIPYRAFNKIDVIGGVNEPDHGRYLFARVQYYCQDYRCEVPQYDNVMKYNTVFGDDLVSVLIDVLDRICDLPHLKRNLYYDYVYGDETMFDYFHRNHLREIKEGRNSWASHKKWCFLNFINFEEYKYELKKFPTMAMKFHHNFDVGAYFPILFTNRITFYASLIFEKIRAFVDTCNIYHYLTNESLVDAIVEFLLYRDLKGNPHACAALDYGVNNPCDISYIKKRKEDNIIIKQPKVTYIREQVENAIDRDDMVVDDKLRWVIISIGFCPHPENWPYKDYFFHLRIPQFHNGRFPFYIDKDSYGRTYLYKRIDVNVKEFILELWNGWISKDGRVCYKRWLVGGFYPDVMTEYGFTRNNYRHFRQGVYRYKHPEKTYLWVPAFRGGDEMKTYLYGWFRLELEYYKMDVAETKFVEKFRRDLKKVPKLSLIRMRAWYKKKKADEKGLW
jgi:hypothetical protein